MNVHELFAYFDANKERLLEELFTFLRFQSISTEAESVEQVNACAAWVESYLSEKGLTTDRWEEGGHPIIFAEWCKAGKDKPTVLVYGHYDVQPVDPLELWQSPPFEPEVRDGEIFARGAQDNKGQCFYTIAAITSLLAENGSLPVNVKILIEGEEEAGSESLERACSKRQDQLKADYYWVVDMGFHAMEQPAITLGLRGMTSMTVTFRGSNTDLHSGAHGGIVYNPNRALVEVLGKLFDEEGRVLVPGFYDGIEDVSPEDKKCIDFHFDPEHYKAMFKAEANGGESAFSPLESAWLRPTLEINGISGGYSGDGFKTVIPAIAKAKISCRLVPGQNPKEIYSALESYINSLAPQGIEVEIKHEHSGNSMRTSPSSAAVQAAAQAYTEVCGIPCSYIMCGGSVPVTASVAAAAGAETVLIGYGLPGDNLHAPNEHFGVERVRLGFATIGRMLELFEKLPLGSA